MIILGREQLEEYKIEFPNARKRLAAHAKAIEAADWQNPQAVKNQFGTASIIGRGTDRVVFNIKGNEYRLVVRIDYARQIVAVRWFGTHAQYDRIDVLTV